VQCGRQCVAALENVKTKMDQREIERRDAAVNEMLIDEFDPEDEPEEPPQAEEVATAVVIAEPTPLDVLPSAPLEEGVASIGDVFASLRTPAAEIDQGRPSVKSTHSVSMAEAVDDLTAMETSAGSEDRYVDAPAAMVFTEVIAIQVHTSASVSNSDLCMLQVCWSISSRSGDPSTYRPAAELCVS
jgi:hypothetical protein